MLKKQIMQLFQKYPIMPFIRTLAILPTSTLNLQTVMAILVLALQTPQERCGLITIIKIRLQISMLDFITILQTIP